MRIFLRNSLFAILPAFMVALTGCQGGGGLGDMMNPLGTGGKKYEAAYLKQNLIPGKTTKDQVLQMFGAPTDETSNSVNGSNDVRWSYRKNQENNFDKYLTMAHKYVSTETSLKMYDASAQVSKGQDVMNDVNTVAGVNSKQVMTGATGNHLTIYFENNVVDRYYLE